MLQVRDHAPPPDHGETHGGSRKMSSRRLLTLTAVLLVLIAAYQVRPTLMAFFTPEPVGAVTYVPPLPGKNTVSNLVVRRNDTGVWQATFDYYFTGEPRGQMLSVEVPRDEDTGAPNVYRP